MPVYAAQLSESPRVIHVQFVEKWTWEDFHANRQAGIDLLAQETRPVYIIADFSRSAPIPPGSVLGQSRALLRRRIASQAMMIVVTNDLLLRTMMDVIQKAYANDIGADLYRVATLDDAHALIASAEAKQPLPAPEPAQPAD